MIRQKEMIKITVLISKEVFMTQGVVMLAENKSYENKYLRYDVNKILNIKPK